MRNFCLNIRLVHYNRDPDEDQKPFDTDISPLFSGRIDNRRGLGSSSLPEPPAPVNDPALQAQVPGGATPPPPPQIVAQQEAALEPKRGRGRPRKDQLASGSAAAKAADLAIKAAPKKPVGKPPVVPRTASEERELCARQAENRKRKPSEAVPGEPKAKKVSKVKVSKAKETKAKKAKPAPRERILHVEEQSALSPYEQILLAEDEFARSSQEQILPIEDESALPPQSIATANSSEQTSVGSSESIFDFSQEESVPSWDESFFQDTTGFSGDFVWGFPQQRDPEEVVPAVPEDLYAGFSEQRGPGEVMLGASEDLYLGFPKQRGPEEVTPGSFMDLYVDFGFPKQRDPEEVVPM